MSKILSGQWFIDADELEKKVLSGSSPEMLRKAPTPSTVEAKRLEGQKLMTQYSKDYESSSRKKSGDMRLLEATARSGTSADKISAFTCLVEDDPIANLRALDALLSMVTSKIGKRYAFASFDVLKELFLSRLLPDRKLKSLLQRPLDALPETRDGSFLLLFWFWEECLKQRYEKFVIALEEGAKDMLPSLKDKAMKTIFVLLKSKSEQERRLLTALVNKLGDPERKYASSAAYHLSCLLSAHPNMKAVVIDEVDSFIFRPHMGLCPKYHAVNFLSQIFLSKRGDGPKIAKRLVDIYFALFTVLITESPNVKAGPGLNRDSRSHRVGKEEKRDVDKQVPLPVDFVMDSRILSALLTGINRAFPFVTSDEADDIIEVQTPILYRLVHSENFNVGVQALMLLYQISFKNQIASDRFYRALYAKLLSPSAITSSKPELFLGLLAKAMKNDMHLKRVAAFSKRLLQVALQRPPQYACGCIFLISEVLKAKPPLWAMVLQSESVDDELEHFEDVVDSDSDKDVLPRTDEPKADPALLPAGYDPRHREPCYCNADRASWWELTLLALHVHPSVAAMARTLLSGANVVYSGNPLIDLSLTAFLDKFMEKKPKASRADGKWHGGSRIAPARKLDMNHHLIGEEILKLAEDEVPPEDMVFHRFYANKLSGKKPKAKKSKVEDEEDLVMGDDKMSGDESDDEVEIDRMLGSGNIVLDGEESEYDYDDLDRVLRDDDDEDLITNGSDDSEPDKPSILHHENKESEDEDDDDDNGAEEDMLDLVDDDEYEQSDETEKEPDHGGAKSRKSKSKKGKSPFASLESYKHLMADSSSSKGKKRHAEPGKKNKMKKKKKRSRHIAYYCSKMCSC